MLVGRNQQQNFSFNNFGIGDRTGTTETHDQAGNVQKKFKLTVHEEISEEPLV